MERIICTISFRVSCHIVAHTYTMGVWSVRIADVSCRSKVVAFSSMRSTLAQGAKHGCVEMVFCCYHLNALPSLVCRQKVIHFT